jgi:hypothetical protein
LIDLFQNDVFLILTDTNGVIFEQASSPAVKTEFCPRQAAMKGLVLKAEAAIRQTMDSSRPGTNIQSFRLNCKSSRIYIAVLSESHRMVVINRGFGGAGPRDPPDFEQSLSQICEQLKASLSGLAPAHAR